MFEDFVFTDRGDYILLERYTGNSPYVNIRMHYKKVVVGSACFTDTSVQYVSLLGASELRLGAFRNSNVEEVTLPEDMWEIPRLCFANCKNLKKINLENVTEIIDFAFTDCENLEEVNLKKCKFIGACGFNKCKKAHFRNLENVEFINEMAFVGCNIGSIVLDNIIEIKDKAFKGSAIFSLKVNNECDINKSAFYDAKISKLTFLKKPNFYPFGIDEDEEKLKGVFIQSNFKDIQYNKSRMSHKESIDVLLNKGFNMNQVNQIIKAYNEDIYMSEAPIDISAEILREIRINYENAPLFYQNIINEKKFENINN